MATDSADVYVLCICGFLALLGNGIILITGAMNRKLRSSTADVMTLSLSLADLLVAVISLPCHVILRYSLPRDTMGCVFVCALFLMFHLVSILNLFILTMEKFIAIRFPFAFHRFYSTTRAVQLCIAGWLIGELFSCVSLDG